LNVYQETSRSDEHRRYCVHGGGLVPRYTRSDQNDPDKIALLAKYNLPPTDRSLQTWLNLPQDRMTALKTNFNLAIFKSLIIRIKLLENNNSGLIASRKKLLIKQTFYVTRLENNLGINAEFMAGREELLAHIEILQDAFPAPFSLDNDHLQSNFKSFSIAKGTKTSKAYKL
jgi:hypothetical protein